LITGLDHVVIAVRDLAAGAAAYERVLGRAAAERFGRDGVAGAVIALDNIAVEIIAPVGDGESAKRLSAALENGEGLKSLVFAVGDIDRAHRHCERVGLNPEPIGSGPPASSRQTTGGNPQPVENGDTASRLEAGSPQWRGFRVNTERTHGVRLFLVQRTAPLAPAARPGGSVSGLDHVVIITPDMERAAALYGARLGLDMRLDRAVAGRSLMFFRCGDAVVEIAHDAGAAHDALWGLSWRVADADAARTRLAEAGLDVSDVRSGRKPGTRVLSVRSGTCGVPTLMIEAQSKRD
jgi:catechol 2,3-dioxygenase-like lactoylglutathione lyase family enzyme